MRKLVAALVAASTIAMGTILGATPAQAQSVEVLGFSVSWDEASMYVPNGCSNYQFNYSYNGGGRAAEVSMQVTDAYGSRTFLGTSALFGVEPGTRGTWSLMLCSLDFASLKAPFTLTATIGDYYGSTRQATAPFAFVSRTPTAPPTTAPPTTATSMLLPYDFNDRPWKVGMKLLLGHRYSGAYFIEWTTSTPRVCAVKRSVGWHIKMKGRGTCTLIQSVVDSSNQYAVVASSSHSFRVR